MEESKKRMEVIADLVSETLGEGHTVTATEVTKNNGMMLEGIRIIRPGMSIHPVIYVVPGMSAGAAARMVITRYKEKLSEIERMQAVTEILSDKKSLLSVVVPSLVNSAANSARLENVPHLPFLDMEVVYKASVNIGNGRGTIMISNELLEHLGITEDELEDAAGLNLAKQEVMIRTFGALLHQLTGEEMFEIDESEDLFLVVSTKDYFNGAALMLSTNVLNEIADRIGGNFYIIPSSIHDFIVCKNDRVAPGLLRHMIKSINENRRVISENDVLTDTLYEYDIESRLVRIAE